MFQPIPRPLVLASTSPYRRRLLARLGLLFETVAPDYDEERNLPLGPRRTALHHAHGKAASVGRPEAIVIGSDQVVALENEILGKPGTIAGAESQLRRLSGRRHRLITALVLVDGARLRRHVDTHWVQVRTLSDEEIRAYVARDRPLDCAGSYRIEAAGPLIMERIDGADPSAIEGLPLMALGRLLRELSA